VEGIGVFGLALGKAFEEKGFLALVLYPLLEKLASTNSNVSFAADLALRAICYHSGYQSVSDTSRMIIHSFGATDIMDFR
jgi:hypothetical protein